MKQYFKNLWLALCGRNPYKEELAGLREMYCAALEKWDKSTHQLEESQRREADFQNLTENLRQRITDKDTLMERMKQDYQQRIERYMREIDRLRQSSAPREKSAT